MSQETNVSIALRLQKITYQDAYIAVPLTESVLSEKEDGTLGIDFEKLLQEAIRISSNPKVDWQIENELIEAHKIQKTAPEDRTKFDPLTKEDK